MTKPQGCRIGRVKLKSGGEIRILNTSCDEGDPDVIEILLGALALARQGVAVAAAVVIVEPDKTVHSTWSTGHCYYHEVLSGTALLLHHLSLEHES